MSSAPPAAVPGSGLDQEPAQDAGGGGGAARRKIWRPRVDPHRRGPPRDFREDRAAGADVRPVREAGRRTRDPRRRADAQLTFRGASSSRRRATWRAGAPAVLSRDPAMRSRAAGIRRSRRHTAGIRHCHSPFRFAHPPPIGCTAQSSRPCDDVTPPHILRCPLLLNPPFVHIVPAQRRGALQERSSPIEGSSRAAAIAGDHERRIRRKETTEDINETMCDL